MEDQWTRTIDLDDSLEYHERVTTDLVRIKNPNHTFWQHMSDMESARPLFHHGHGTPPLLPVIPPPLSFVDDLHPVGRGWSLDVIVDVDRVKDYILDRAEEPESRYEKVEHANQQNSDKQSSHTECKQELGKDYILDRTREGPDSRHEKIEYTNQQNSDKQSSHAECKQELEKEQDHKPLRRKQKKRKRTFRSPNKKRYNKKSVAHEKKSHTPRADSLSDANNLAASEKVIITNEKEDKMLALDSSQHILDQLAVIQMSQQLVATRTNDMSFALENSGSEQPASGLEPVASQEQSTFEYDEKQDVASSSETSDPEKSEDGSPTSGSDARDEIQDNEKSCTSPAPDYEMIESWFYDINHQLDYYDDRKIHNVDLHRCLHVKFRRYLSFEGLYILLSNTVCHTVISRILALKDLYISCFDKLRVTTFDMVKTRRHHVWDGLLMGTSRYKNISCRLGDVYPDQDVDQAHDPLHCALQCLYSIACKSNQIQPRNVVHWELELTRARHQPHIKHVLQYAGQTREMHPKQSMHVTHASCGSWCVRCYPIFQFGTLLRLLFTYYVDGTHETDRDNVIYLSYVAAVNDVQNETMDQTNLLVQRQKPGDDQFFVHWMEALQSCYPKHLFQEDLEETTTPIQLGRKWFMTGTVMTDKLSRKWKLQLVNRSMLFNGRQQRNQGETET